MVRKKQNQARDTKIEDHQAVIRKDTKNIKEPFKRLLNRYNFAYVGCDTVNTPMNQLNTLAPKLIQQTSNQVDQITQ